MPGPVMMDLAFIFWMYLENYTNKQLSQNLINKLAGIFVKIP